MAEIPTNTKWTSSETASASGPVESSSKKEYVTTSLYLLTRDKGSFIFANFMQTSQRNGKELC